MMDDFLQGLPFAFFCVDYVAIFSKNMEEHVSLLIGLRKGSGGKLEYQRVQVQLRSLDAGAARQHRQRH